MNLTAAEWLLLGVGLGTLSAAVTFLLWLHRGTHHNDEPPP